jgi:hypothetical protein
MATLTLDNGIKISVVAGDRFYNDSKTYEVAMFVQDEFLPLNEWDDVIGWQTPKEITTLMKEAQVDGAKFMDKLDFVRQNRNNAG